MIGKQKGASKEPDKGAQRSSGNELEGLVEIINALPVVKQHVLDKIRAVKERQEKEAKGAPKKVSQGE